MQALATEGTHYYMTPPDSSLTHWAEHFLQAFSHQVDSSTLTAYAMAIEQQHNALSSRLQKSNKLLNNLLQLAPKDVVFSAGTVIEVNAPSASFSISEEGLTALLKRFMPWRKGPYQLFGVTIDTEWRSDAKWERMRPYLPSLQDKLILDVGCGNGYHLWRMLPEAPRMLVGVDPTVLFLEQFHVFKQYLITQPIHILPIGLEQLPATGIYDIVFCMGVLYHRRDPIQALLDLKQQLKPNGVLVLETLIVPGDENTCLIPQQTYAKMSNVWFIPSTKQLIRYLHRVGFKRIEVCDETPTTIKEQRKTAWIEGQSLEDFLDPGNKQLTVEGYPAPIRCTIIAMP